MALMLAESQMYTQIGIVHVILTLIQHTDKGLQIQNGVETQEFGGWVSTEWRFQIIWSRKVKIQTKHHMHI